MLDEIIEMTLDDLKTAKYKLNQFIQFAPTGTKSQLMKTIAEIDKLIHRIEELDNE